MPTAKMADHNQQRVLEYLKRTEDQTVQLDPIIRNYDDYQRLRDTFYSLKDNDVQTSGIQDGPETDEARQQYVEDLVAYVSPCTLLSNEAVFQCGVKRTSSFDLANVPQGHAIHR